MIGNSIVITLNHILLPESVDTLFQGQFNDYYGALGHQIGQIGGQVTGTNITALVFEDNGFAWKLIFDFQQVKGNSIFNIDLCWLAI